MNKLDEKRSAVGRNDLTSAHRERSLEVQGTRLPFANTFAVKYCTRDWLVWVVGGPHHTATDREMKKKNHRILSNNSSPEGYDCYSILLTRLWMLIGAPWVFLKS